MTLGVLSALDLLPVVAGRGSAQAIRDSLALARRLDELGFARYWVAEHHNSHAYTSAAPEILLAAAAATTRRIRIGAGGVMIPNHAPLHVVEMFRTLEAIAPGRVDLGLGRSLGADPVTSQALRKRPDGDDSAAQLDALFAFADSAFDPAHPHASIRVQPVDAPTPPIWMLGSSKSGAELAASLGVGFAFAAHFNRAAMAEALAVYRARFQPSASLREPRVIVSIWAVCGETDEHAEALALPLRVAQARMLTNTFGPLPTLAEADDYTPRVEELLALKEFDTMLLVGGPRRMEDELRTLARESAADEIMVVTSIPVLEERIKSYERLAAIAGHR
jgi:luciferase family oxidoreductase group 1